MRWYCHHYSRSLIFSSFEPKKRKLRKTYVYKTSFCGNSLLYTLYACMPDLYTTFYGKTRIIKCVNKTPIWSLKIIFLSQRAACNILWHAYSRLLHVYFADCAWFAVTMELNRRCLLTSDGTPPKQATIVLKSNAPVLPWLGTRIYARCWDQIRAREQNPFTP